MKRPKWLPIVARIVAISIAVLTSAAFGIHYGFNYGVNNQNSYLLGGLRLLHPDLLVNDWVAAETAEYHPVFSYLAAVLMLDSSGWAVAIANTICNALGALAIFWICQILFSLPLALTAFLLTLAVNFITATNGVGGSYVFGGILQPSTLGSLGALIGFGFFLRGRWLASGMALALGGLLHANYLILSIAVFTLSHLILREKEFIAYGTRQILPLVGALALLSPIILQSAFANEAGQARDILLKIRSPHHYVPGSFEADFIPFAGWSVLGLGAGLRVLESPGPHRRAGVLLAAMLVVVWVGTLLTTAIYEPRVAQLFVWRFAPFCDVLAQILAFGTVAVAIARPRALLACSPAAAALTAVGVGILGMFYGKRSNEQLMTIIVWLIAVVALTSTLALAGHGARRVVDPQKLRSLARRVFPFVPLPGLIVAGLLVWNAGYERVRRYEARSSLLTGLPIGEAQLYEWVRRHTDKRSLFLIPPQMENFRFNAQRAIVVDWKTLPLKPDELIAWHQRMHDVTALPQLNVGSIARGYDHMDQQRLEQLHSRYRFEYAVIRSGAARRFSGYPIAYQNPHFSVLAMNKSKQVELSVPR